jgi:hypothetical protein
MAETYWISFQIGAGGNRDQRYENVLEAVRRATADMMWTEFDHFIVFDSAESIDVVAESIQAAFDPSRDLAVLAQAGTPEARVIGALQDPMVLELMPYARREPA